MITLTRVLQIAALLCFALAALGVPAAGVVLVPLGLALWVLSVIV